MVYEIKDIKKIDFELSECIATIGFFDGVHLGHQFLLKHLNNKKKNLKTTVITFDTHFNKESLTSFDAKVLMLENNNIDNILLIANNKDNFNVSKEDFVAFLKKLNIKSIVCGDDFKFGYQASGNVDFLKKFFEVDIIDYKNDINEKISSRDIRQHLDDGNIEMVSQKLGRAHFISGIVQRGDQIGKTINFPTANINSNFYVPNNGVYLTKTLINDRIYLSLTNIGTRPTVDGNQKRIETHILDFDEDIYGVEIKVEFIKRIRSEEKFSDLDELKSQIKKDVLKAKEYRGN
ncbi:MAG: bifunctional riboflavin kinase/FAD synthetase [Mycoplasmatales bacterium]